jgi:hypothetical protein
MPRLILLVAVLLSGLALVACQHAAARPDPAPVSGHVTDMAAFDAWIATHPTPTQFRARYPDVLLVLPGAMTTMEMRNDNSRYFAELDAQDRITGGKFQ